MFRIFLQNTCWFFAHMKTIFYARARNSLRNVWQQSPTDRMQNLFRSYHFSLAVLRVCLKSECAFLFFNINFFLVVEVSNANTRGLFFLVLITSKSEEKVYLTNRNLVEKGIFECSSFWNKRNIKIWDNWSQTYWRKWKIEILIIWSIYQSFCKLLQLSSTSTSVIRQTGLRRTAVNVNETFLLLQLSTS